MRLLMSMLALLLVVSASVNAAAIPTVTINIDSSVVNDSTTAWSGYEIELLGGGDFVAGAIASPFILDLGLSDSKKLVFSGAIVNIGESVDFDISVLAELKDFVLDFDGFKATPIAIPEPATMALLGLGAFGVIRRRAC